ncbi:MAG: hypothetical protein WHS44_09510 [Fimbriimonadales bacterium]|nr:MAG: hypothetical protein KatS3mg018_0239 [Fimbriimonadales bacterium]
MRRVGVLLGLLWVACGGAQVDKAADEWLQKCFQAYSQLQSLQSKTTLTVLMTTPRIPDGTPVQKYLYAYTAQPPARLNLLVKDLNAKDDGQRYLANGQSLQVNGESKPVANSGAALLEQLTEAGVLPTYDLVFLTGGRNSQEKFRKQITQLRVASETDKQITLTGRIKNERGKEDGLEIVLDKESALMLRLAIRAEVKIEEQPGALTLLMEFEPKPNVEVSEQTFTADK